MTHHSRPVALPHVVSACLRLLTLAIPAGLVLGARGEPEPLAAAKNGLAPAYLPNRLGLKFEATSAPAEALRKARTKGMALDEVSLSPELDALKTKYEVWEIVPVFSGFEVTDASGMVIAVETMHEHMVRVAQKLGRTAPTREEAARVPDLTTVYALKIAEEADVLEAAAAFSACPGVEYAEPGHIFRACGPPDPPNDPYWSSSDSWGQGYDDLWGLKRIGCLEAWCQSTGSGIVVAVVDTGVDYMHEEMHDNMWLNALEDLNGNGHWDPGDANAEDDDGNGKLDDVNGWNAITEYGNPMDDHGHGTHVAGAAAAIGYNATGVIGVAFEAKIMAVKVLDSTGWGSSEDVAEGIKYAAENGAAIINCSLGGIDWDWIISNAIQYAHGWGRLVVCAAGNKWPLQPRGGHFCFPARHPLTLAVGATNYGNPAPDSEGRSWFSLTGFSLDVGAPGGGEDSVNILSLQADDRQPEGSRYVVSPGYYRMIGTSMAAPHVSGLAAMLRSARPYLSPQELRQTIRVTADDLGPAGRDDQHGFGRIDAPATVNPSLSPARCELYILNPIPDLFNPWDYYGYIDITGTAKGAQFSQWKLEWSDDDARSWNFISQGTSPKDGETLGRFYDNNLNDAEYIFRLTVRDSLGRDFEHRSSVMELDGWNGEHVRFPANPYTHPEFMDSAPAIAQLDPYQGGPLDIVVSTRQLWFPPDVPSDLGRLAALSGESPSATTLMDLDSCHSSPAVANLDGNPASAPHIVVLAEDASYSPPEGVFCLDRWGGVEWHFPDRLTSEDWAVSPAVADIRPDWYGLEVVACSSRRVCLLSRYGDLLWEWLASPGQPYFGILNAPTVSNLGDPYTGMKIIVVGYWRASPYTGAVYVLDAYGSELWHYNLPESPSQTVFSSAAVGQIDGYGLHDMAFGSKNGKLYCVSGEGSLLWGFDAGASIETSPAIGYISNMGPGPQIVFGASDGKVYCVNRDGSLCWQFDTRGGPIYSSPAIAPVYYGYPGVIIGSANTRLYFIDGYYGTLIRVFRGFANVTGSPTVADVNQDTPGVEVVVGFDDGRLFLLNSAENDCCPPGAMPWPTFQHDNARTGCYDGWY